MQLDDYQRDILIRTALGEAAGEGKRGMEAVLHVILNRANSGDYSSDPAKVALQKNQFSAWNDSSNGGNNPSKWSTNSKSYKTAAAALDAVLGGAPDPTGGAMFYHAKGITPYWADEANTNGVVKIGNHRFYPTHPVPPANIPDVASETDTTPPSPMPARPFGSTRPADRLDAMLPDQAMFGVRPGGPGPQPIDPGQFFGTGGLGSDQHWGGMAGYNPETRQFDSPTVGNALSTALMPKVPALPSGPIGRRPPAPPPIVVPTLNDTRSEQNTTYSPPAPTIPLPRMRPEPPLGFEPLPAPPPLAPQTDTVPPSRPPMPDLTPSGRPMWFTSRPPGEPASPEPEEAAFVPKADPKTFDVLPKGPMGRSGIRGDTTALIARPVTTIAMDPLTNQPIPPPIATGPRAAPPIPLTPSPLLRAGGPLPIPVMPLRARPQTPYMTSPSYMNTPGSPYANPGGPITFRKGDTVSQLARDRGMTVKSFADLFGIKDPNRIYAGQTVVPSVPVPRTRPPSLGGGSTTPRNSGRWEGVLDEFGMIL